MVSIGLIGAESSRLALTIVVETCCNGWRPFFSVRLAVGSLRCEIQTLMAANSTRTWRLDVIVSHVTIPTVFCRGHRQHSSHSSQSFIHSWIRLLVCSFVRSLITKCRKHIATMRRNVLSAFYGSIRDINTHCRRDIVIFPVCRNIKVKHNSVTCCPRLLRLKNMSWVIFVATYPPRQGHHMHARQYSDTCIPWYHEQTTRR